MSRICVCCEAGASMTPFSDEMHQVEFRGHIDLVSGLAGYRCPACGEIEFDDDGVARYAAAGDALIAAIRSKHGAELRRCEQNCA
jgi:HTH-type transcriptional regulator/antitoxin MqsA